MVQVSVSAKVTVAGGPALPLGAELAPDSYMVSEATLAPQGQADDTDEMPIVPDPVALTLLAISATEATTGKTASVSVVPLHGGTAGDPFTLDGTFLLANGDILSRLVQDGPDGFRVTNAGPVSTTVRLLATFRDG
jgi:hypothetical protein